MPQSGRVAEQRDAFAKVALLLTRLYHYTSREAVARILRDCTLRPSHAPWGFGVFLTDLGPTSMTRAELSDALFGPGRFDREWQRLEAYMAIPLNKADAVVHPRNPHVFVADGKVSIAGEDIEVGFWLGALDDPADTAGWAVEPVVHCAPSLDELRALFERLLPND